MDVSTFDFAILSTTALLIFVAYFFGGIVDAVCGGGGLVTVPALMSLGMPAHMIVGSNHSSMLLGAATSSYEYNKAKKVDAKAALTALPFGLVGVFLGTRLNLVLDERYLMIVMTALVPALAVFSIVKKDVGEEDYSELVTGRNRAVRCAFIGLIVATYHSFYGPASGVFFMMSFAALLKFDAVKANGTTRLLLLCLNIPTAIIYFFSGNVCLKSALVGTIGYMFGNYVGARIAISKGARVIKPLYYCVLAGLMIKLVIGLL